MKYKRAAFFILLAVVAVLGITRKHYAGVYGVFPGLTKLIGRADVIAVVQILEGTPAATGMGGYAKYNVRVLKTLKGALPQDRMTLNLRPLRFNTAASRARKVVIDLMEDPIFIWIEVDCDTLSAATSRWLERYGDQRFSLTDAVSFEIMKRERLTVAFAFDHHFRIAGYDLLQ